MAMQSGDSDQLVERGLTGQQSSMVNVGGQIGNRWPFIATY